MINITKTWLPEKEKYLSYVDKIYKSGWVTNNGSLVKELESRLSEYLGVKNIVLVANGTIALEVAYRLLNLEGEVVTTPFSFVATTSSLVTNHLTPVFSDIDPNTFTLDAKKIEQSISPNTSAIVPVHVFGNACDIESIEEIANKYNLKIIYDGAHAFGVKYNNKSIFNYGDISTLSFHATKLFHSIEGGALVINDDALAEEARLFTNFGIDGVDSVKTLGINAKMNEFEAAMGLCVLDDIDFILNERKTISEIYEYHLKDMFTLQHQNSESTRNYSYFPMLFEAEEETLRTIKRLHDSDIFPRRYFYPSLDTLPYLKRKAIMPHSRDIASRILTLPIYPGLDRRDQMKIIDIIKEL